MADARSGLGRAYRTVGTVEPAREALLESLALYETIGNLIGQSGALGALSSIAMLQNQFADAERFARQSLALTEETDHHRRAYGLGLLGWAQYNHGLFAEAQTTIETAIHMHRNTGDKMLPVANTLRLSEILLQQGKYAESLKAIDTARSLAANNGKLGSGLARVSGSRASLEAWCRCTCPGSLCRGE